MTSDYIHLLLHFPPFLEPCALYAVAPLTVFHDGAAVRKKIIKGFFVVLMLPAMMITRNLQNQAILRFEL